MNPKLNEAITRLSNKGVEFIEQDPYNGRYDALKKNILTEKNRPNLRFAIASFSIKGSKVDVGLHYDIELDSFVVRSDSYKIYTTEDGTKVRISSTAFHAATSPRDGQERTFKIFKDGTLLSKADWDNKDVLVADELAQLGTFDRPDYLEIIRAYSQLCNYKITADDINDVRRGSEDNPIQKYNSDQLEYVAKQINDFIADKRSSKGSPSIPEGTTEEASEDSKAI